MGSALWLRGMAGCLAVPLGAPLSLLGLTLMSVGRVIPSSILLDLQAVDGSSVCHALNLHGLRGLAIATSAPLSASLGLLGLTLSAVGRSSARSTSLGLRTVYGGIASDALHWLAGTAEGLAMPCGHTRGQPDIDVRVICRMAGISRPWALRPGFQILSLQQQLLEQATQGGIVRPHGLSAVEGSAELSVQAPLPAGRCNQLLLLPAEAQSTSPSSACMRHSVFSWPWLLTG